MTRHDLICQNRPGPSTNSRTSIGHICRSGNRKLEQIQRRFSVPIARVPHISSFDRPAKF